MNLNGVGQAAGRGLRRELLLILRPAIASDLALLQRWDEQPHVIAANTGEKWVWEVELNQSPDWREQLIAEIDGSPVGFVQIIDPAREESHYWGEIAQGLRAIDIWVGEKSNLGMGYGSAMMNLALARCFAVPEVCAVLVDPLVSNKRAHRFYGRCGFQFVERRWFGADECCVYRIGRGEFTQSSRQGAEAGGETTPDGTV
jgi:aminoglycoside 6'-N-acetyltransferase